MASKRAAKAKKTGKKQARRATAAPKSKITSKSITFSLTPAEVKAARECLKKSGEIRYSFKEVRVSKLPHVLDDGKQID